MILELVGEYWEVRAINDHIYAEEMEARFASRLDALDYLEKKRKLLNSRWKAIMVRIRVERTED